MLRARAVVSSISSICRPVYRLAFGRIRGCYSCATPVWCIFVPACFFPCACDAKRLGFCLRMFQIWSNQAVDHVPTPWCHGMGRRPEGATCCIINLSRNVACKLPKVRKPFRVTSIAWTGRLRSLTVSEFKAKSKAPEFNTFHSPIYLLYGHFLNQA